MAHFAQLDENSVVIQVIVVNNDVIQNLPFPESEPIGIEFCQSLFGSGTVWKQTSYNNNFRKRYAGIGCSYNQVTDEFDLPPLSPIAQKLKDFKERIGGVPFDGVDPATMNESEAP